MSEYDDEYKLSVVSKQSKHETSAFAEKLSKKSTTNSTQVPDISVFSNFTFVVLNVCFWLWNCWYCLECIIHVVCGVICLGVCQEVLNEGTKICLC